MRVIAAILGSALSTSCLLQLDTEISCGDGFVDTRAGEACDPAVPSSFQSACVGTRFPRGMGACDPNTCTLVNDAAQCSICGDDRIDLERDEECDGDSLGGNACPGGNGALQCAADCKLDYSQCDPCGNGQLDDGEECDYAAGGGLGTTRACAGSGLGSDNELPPLSSPRPDKPFTSGETSLCRSDCRFDRTGCGYCGDGVRDNSLPLPGGATVPAEWCDGNIFDNSRLVEELGPLCANPLTERPNVSCGDDCRSFVELAGGCCLRRNAACPGDDGLRCCYEFAVPDEQPCYESFEANGVLRSLCR